MPIQESNAGKKMALTNLVLALFCLGTVFGDMLFPVDGCTSDTVEMETVSSATDHMVVGSEKEGGDILQKSLAISGDFTYLRQGRLDPFMPFITDDRVQAELVVEEKKLTGMQLFEPGQLTLVGIIKTTSGPLAMVQDSVGKGYPLRNGMKIGRTGEVVGIVTNKVLIKEEAYKNARTKEIIYKTTEMVLKKEGVNE